MTVPTHTDPNQPDPFVTRRRITWIGVSAFLGAALLMFARFFFPRVLFRAQSALSHWRAFGVRDSVWTNASASRTASWVVREPDRLFVILAKCTHLGCTPNWIESENKFKCPCHGSGYDMEGRNFEGPAPRPLDRAHVELDAEGQVLVDLSRLFACPPAGASEFDRPESNVSFSGKQG